MNRMAKNTQNFLQSNIASSSSSSFSIESFSCFFFSPHPSSSSSPSSISKSSSSFSSSSSSSSSFSSPSSSPSFRSSFPSLSPSQGSASASASESELEMPTAAAIALISAPLPPIYEELTLSLIPAAVSSSMLSLCHHRHTNRERVPDLLCTVEVFGLPQLAPISLEKTLTSFDAASALNDSNVATQDASHVVSSSSSSSSSTSSSSSSSSSSFSSSIHLTTFMPSAHRPTPADVISHSYL